MNKEKKKTKIMWRKKNENICHAQLVFLPDENYYKSGSMRCLRIFVKLKIA